MPVKDKLRILHAPTTVGGNPSGLSFAEREMGYASDNMALLQNYFNYKVDTVILKDDRTSIGNELRRWAAAIKALCKYNVLHYNFGQSILPIRTYPSTRQYSRWKVFLYCHIYMRFTEFLDLKVAHYLKKVVAITYQGDDIRQGDYCLEHYEISPAKETGNGYYTPLSDCLKRSRIRKADRYADLIYVLNPDLMNVLPERAQFVPYASVFPNKWPCIGVKKDVEVPHIVHAPSHRKFKGTSHILKAFERLEGEGILFRYTLVENLSHEDAKKVYETADLVVDQVLAGFYGALAVECMALGKPVVCYLRESDMHHLPNGMWDDMPVINTTPDTVYETLKMWLTTKKGSLREQGLLSRSYVEKWHDPQKIAQDILDDYERIYKQKKMLKRGAVCAA